MRYEKLQHLSVYLRRLTIMVATAAFGLWAMPPEPVAAAGVGYTLPSYSVSKYKLDNVNSAYRSHVMDLSADPGKVGVRPNEFYLNLGDPAVREAYERRYGPDTAGPRFKSWIGPSFEVRSVVADALSWKYSGGLIRPTEVEITDAQATGDRVWYAYLQATQDGWTPERPIHFTDPNKRYGMQVDADGNITRDSFWGVPYYRFNDGGWTVPPPPPPIDPPPPPPINQCDAADWWKACCPTCPTCPVCPAPPAPPPACAPVPEFVRRTIVKGARFTSPRAWSAVRSWASTCPGWVTP